MSNDGIHGWIFEQMSPAYAKLFVERIMGQNDCEGLFGEAARGSATKATPRELGPRLQDGEFLDAQRSDAERAKHWLIYESKRKKYDSADSMQSFDEAYAWGSGLGDAWESVTARVWRDKQQVGAVRAAQGKQESARTFNTFWAGAKAIAASCGSNIKRACGGEDSQ